MGRKLKNLICTYKMRNHSEDFRGLDPIPSLGCMISPNVKHRQLSLEISNFSKNRERVVKPLLGVVSTFTPEQRLRKRINRRL